ncbi:ABC transporter substrate-binding protein [Acuticoccus sp.]|uniref:ABC transporter substrate-binding protein n=1 Tax=Acuticoccus sp. TaxID=1904378 RepID=UPI003B51E400
MTHRATLALGAAFAAGLLATPVVTPVHAQDATCGGLDRPVVFGGLDYGSAAFHTALARTILDEGYGCATDVIPGATLVLHQGLPRGDIDIIMEVWTANPAQAFVDAEADGTVERLGATFPDASEGWFVPRYLVEGEGAPAPELRSVDQLADYKELFEDPEEPSKGRFLNCVAGWQCEVVNTKKLIAYGLDDDYSNVRPGTGAALEAAVESAVLRERPVLFYHWAPTALVGKYDFIKLEEPAYDEATWSAMMEAEEPDAATAYPDTRVVIGANTEFTEAAPELEAFLQAYGTTAAQTSKALATMADPDVSPEDAAMAFLRDNRDTWQAWVPEEVAVNVGEAIAE